MKYITYTVVALCFACANVVAPNGGVKDVLSPKVLQMEPVNNTNYFKENEISIEFDELIQFNDQQNIIISPYIKDGVETIINKNKLKIRLKTQLEENTTYSISLNKLVKDVNEGNIVDDLTYQFSTGQYIDTLSIRGVVKDAFTAMLLENVWVMLYNDDSDSVLYKDTPKYVVKSSELGEFVFSNLPNNSYSIYAIQDLDNNLRFSIPNEKVGFYPEKVKSQRQDVEIHLFDETAKSDSITSLYTDTTANTFGNLIIDSLPQKSPLVIELLQDENVIIRKQATYPTQIDSLLAGNYSLRIIEDDNKNGIWDSGDLYNKKQAEKVMLYPKTINIREDWDVVIEWETN